jgi:hypothetical protein
MKKTILSWRLLLSVKCEVNSTIHIDSERTTNRTCESSYEYAGNKLNDVREELEIDGVNNKTKLYRNQWLSHTERMHRYRFPSQTSEYLEKRPIR